MNLDFKYLKHLGKLGYTNIHPGGKAATSILIENLKIKSGMRVLEIGCGTGQTLVDIASRFDVSVYGLDILPDMFKRARRRVKFAGLTNRVRLLKNENSSPLPFENETFDRVYTESALCFHDQPDANFLLNEIFRVLKHGGKYIANEAIWKDGVSLEAIRQVNDNALANFGLGPSTGHFFFLEDWKKQFAKTGFECISSELIEDLHSGAVRMKGFRFSELASDIYSFISKLKVLFNPFLLKEFIHYKNLIKNQSLKTQILEARLLVLSKV